jgi:hypothetical protein
MVLFLGICIFLWQMRLHRPSPLALGSAFPKLCVVSTDEIQAYSRNNEVENAHVKHLRRETYSKQAKVNKRYVGQMVDNTKLFQQIARFEKLKIDPYKSSLEYDTRETLTLRLVDEASSVRWFLFKAQTSLALRSWIGVRVSQRTVQKILGEYKQLEQDFVALVAMASDDTHYTMLVERLGLNNWRLFDGGSSETPA